jgi:3-methyladenine DNA glycosylase AlkD
LMASTLSRVRADVQAAANPRDAVFLQRFFKTGPGQYGEGDIFLGIRVPATRSIVRRHRDLPMADRLKLLRSKYHEERLVALLLLVHAYQKGDEKTRVGICRDYLAHSEYINNWDLVDCSAEHIVGPELGNSVSEARLAKLARSKLLWDRRIAMLATFHWIKQGKFGPALRIAEILVNDEEDLMHKAVGWMLREIGKRDRLAEEKFLRKHCRTMPRTALRYAIEHFGEAKRKRYLKGEP